MFHFKSKEKGKKKEVFVIDTKNVFQDFHLKNNLYFLKAYIWEFLLVLLCVMFYIANRYHCQQKLLEINDKRKELEIVKFKSLSKSAELQYKTRQSVIKEMLQERGIELVESQTPPCYIPQVPKKESE